MEQNKYARSMLKEIEYFELNDGIFYRPAVAGFTNGLP